MKIIIPKIGDVVQINSSEWYVWTGEYWRRLTIDEQLDLED